MPPKKIKDEKLPAKDSAGPRYKGKKKKSSKKIKKPSNCYFCFLKEMRPTISADNIVESSKILGDMWKKLSEEDKMHYKKLADKELQNHINTKNEIEKNRKKRPLSKYNEFVKKELAELKSKNPDIKHREAFSQVAKQWSDTKKYTDKWKETANID